MFTMYCYDYLTKMVKFVEALAINSIIDALVKTWMKWIKQDAECYNWWETCIKMVRIIIWPAIYTHRQSIHRAMCMYISSTYVVVYTYVYAILFMTIQLIKTCSRCSDKHHHSVMSNDVTRWIFLQFHQRMLTIPLATRVLKHCIAH